jgi:hypothetical protein
MYGQPVFREQVLFCRLADGARRVWLDNAIGPDGKGDCGTSQRMATYTVFGVKYDSLMPNPDCVQTVLVLQGGSRSIEKVGNTASQRKSRQPPASVQGSNPASYRLSYVK